MMSSADLRTRVADARRRLEALKAARSAAETAPVDRETAITRIDEILASAHANRANHFEFLSSRAGGFSRDAFSARGSADLLGLLTVLAPSAIRETMIENIRPGGLTETERLETLAKIDASTIELEIQEELDLRDLDTTVGHEHRRRGASPAILLAPIEELIAAAQQMKPPAPAAARRTA
ncbi:hypothetical protein J2Y55_004569 [Bosea sp. BE125]|uniref:hypothetical protein n=1 Tax=Bosea sp. BE125 TaxID=2817909 RepID=UPI002863CD7F|nr:hypothetical protein [Bosea sp. BE125]MDR6873542.1 hypothetical protein [Bosea sp. BE125]